MKTIKGIALLGVITFFCWPGAVFAEYTLVLKNGRRITVQSYREEGGMIKFHGLGGEIGISRDQIQSIVKAATPETRGMAIPGIERAPLAPAGIGPEEEKKAPVPGAVEAKGDKPSGPGEKALSPEEMLKEARAREEKEFQDRVRQITEQLKATMERYSRASGGSGGPAPTLLQGEEAIKARTEDLMSRLRDAQYNPAGPSDAGGVKLTTPSTFAGAPPVAIELRPGEIIPRVDVPLPAYTGREKELSELRNQINQLQKERDRLIEEMKQKNLPTGSLFLD